MKNEYELVLILNVNITAEKKRTVLDQIKKLLGKEGEIKEKKEWGKRQLSYPIKKQSEGFFALLKLNMEGKEVKRVNDKLKLNEDILRFLLIRR